MADPITRRGFLASGLAAAAVGSGVARGVAPSPGAPAFLPTRVKPAIVCSVNGHPQSIEKALAMLGEGADTLDAAVAAVNLVENDPNDTSVGYGGLPNEEGVVELDSCCMHGPSNNAGAVASLRNIKNPASVAKDVLWYTDHILLVGEGALRFAKARGFKEEDLLTERAREAWLRWKSKLSSSDDWLEPEEKRPELRKDAAAGKRDTGTINFNVCNEKGEVSGVTTTSGLAFKIPGRVGDSPLIGAGLYVDGRIGAAGSTGRGEAVILACGSHTVVEAMRQGMHPKDACVHGARRVVEMSTMPYLVRKDGRPDFQVQFYAVDVKGRVGAASIFPSKFGKHDADGTGLADCAHLFDR